MQKYGVSNSSGSRMTCAPEAAAWRTSCSARTMLARVSQSQDICSAATATGRGGLRKCSGAFDIAHLPLRCGTQVTILLACRTSPLRERQQHRRMLLVVPVGIAMEADEIVLLELDRDQDVARRCDREQQMPLRHPRCRPEGEQEAEVERVAHELVEERNHEVRVLVLDAAQIAGDLPQPEEIEVVDQEGAQQYREPAEDRERNEDRGERAAARIPDDSRHRPPLPHEEDETQAREQHIGGALDRPRYDLSPGPLEPLARHHAVLDGEQPEQQRIDDEGLQRELFLAGVDRLRHVEVLHQADRINKGGEKQTV